MTIGVNIVEQIVDAATARASAFFGTAWKPLPYKREYHKNPANIHLGYGFNVMDGLPGNDQVIGSYCLTINLELILIQTIVKKASEREIEQAVFDLHAWADRAAKDFRNNKIGIPEIVLKVADHTIATPEYLSDATQVALKINFPITFRQSLR